MNDTPLTAALVDALPVEYDGTDAFQNRSSLIKFAASLERDRAKLLAAMNTLLEEIPDPEEYGWDDLRKAITYAQQLLKDITP